MFNQTIPHSTVLYLFDSYISPAARRRTFRCSNVRCVTHFSVSLSIYLSLSIAHSVLLYLNFRRGQLYCSLPKAETQHTLPFCPILELHDRLCRLDTNRRFTRNANDSVPSAPSPLFVCVCVCVCVPVYRFQHFRCYISPKPSIHSTMSVCVSYFVKKNRIIFSVFHFAKRRHRCWISVAVFHPGWACLLPSFINRVSFFTVHPPPPPRSSPTRQRDEQKSRNDTRGNAGRGRVWCVCRLPLGHARDRKAGRRVGRLGLGVPVGQCRRQAAHQDGVSMGVGGAGLPLLILYLLSSATAAPTAASRSSTATIIRRTARPRSARCRSG